MASASACVPMWIHAVLRERARAKSVGMYDKPIARDGCRVTPDNTIHCTPEEMRATVEIKVKALGLMPPHHELSLDAYSIARNIQSEAGNGSIPEKVGIAQAAIDRAKEEGISISRLTMKDGQRYGRQRGTNPRVSTSKDPTWEDIVIAELAIRNTFTGFVQGATYYFGPKYLDDKIRIYKQWANGWGSDVYGLAWIGPTPGIDHRHQFFFRKIPKASVEWKKAYDAGLIAIRETQKPAIANAAPCDVIAVPQAFSFGRAAGALAVAVFFSGAFTFFATQWLPEATSRPRRG